MRERWRSVLFIAVIAVPSAGAQTQPCRPAFDFVVDKVALDYPGFPDKVNVSTRGAYDSRTAAWRAKADAAASDSACLAALQGWAAFFQEGHMAILTTATPSQPSPATPSDTSPEAVRLRFASAPSRRLAAEDTLRYLRGPGADPVEGVWTSFSGAYRIAIVPDGTGKGFDLVVLQADGVWWTPGQIKGHLRHSSGGGYEGDYLFRDHSFHAVSGTLNRNLLALSDGVRLVREWPHLPGDVARVALEADLPSNVTFDVLDAHTARLRLPSFNDSYAGVIDSVLRAHAAELRSLDDLIVDVRGNGGGSDYVYAPVMPLLYTRPIIDTNASILATPDNIAKFDALAVDTTLPRSQRETIAKMAKDLRAHMGQLMHRDDDTLTLPATLPKPMHVAIIIDRGCGSSCEEFLLSARQSAKVKLYGANTAGVLDYANTWHLDTPDGRFRLYYPTSRSQRLPSDPVDPMGIPPDVRIPTSELLPLQWVKARLEDASP